MPNRREFVTTLASAAAGIYVQTPSTPRREVMVGSKRVKVIDVHCHCVIDVADIVKGTKLASSGGGGGGNSVLGPSRLQAMDQQGIDMQALSINGYWWYAVKDRSLADRIVHAADDGLAAWCKQHPVDRWVGGEAEQHMSDE